MKKVLPLLVLMFGVAHAGNSPHANPQSAKDQAITFGLTKKYINLPVSHKAELKRMVFEVKDAPQRITVIRLAEDQPDYWVFYDVSSWKGKKLTIRYEGKPDGLKKIYQDDQIVGQDCLYKEKNRPQFHFSTRRGRSSDPNGLVFYDGEYHLFYQHNPFEVGGPNRHWGHAVSRDLVHWTELPSALYPDAMGIIFSGSAVIDYNNTAGFNRKNEPAMVAAYTSNGGRQRQCLAYSLDKGRTFTKYKGNPVLDSSLKWNSWDTRDPKMIWYAPEKHWVLVLNERDGNSIYNSTDLKHWEYKSHVTGFWECPELFELPVDGDPKHTKWVMCGASGTYMLGSFNGQVFTPEAGKFYYCTGSMYAAQTFNNIPVKDGRRIQIGWGRIAHDGMPFNGVMLLPTELTLRTTSRGIRLFSVPVKETEQVFRSVGHWKSLSSAEANRHLQGYSGKDCLRVRTTIHLSHAIGAGLNLYGQQLVNYDMNQNTINGVFYSPDNCTSMELTADIYIDRSVVEVFIDHGAYSYSMKRMPMRGNQEGLLFWGHNIEVKDLEVFTAKSIW